MRRSLPNWPVKLAAAALMAAVGAMVLVWSLQGPRRTADFRDLSGPDAGQAGSSGDPSSGAPFASGGVQEGAQQWAAPGTGDAGGDQDPSEGSRRRKRRDGPGPGPDGDDGGGKGRKIRPEDIPPSAITDALIRQALRHSSGPLGEALQKALESGERGPLLGLLIANLTEKGTNFTAAELPLLLEALKTEQGHELQSLLLTHLDRLDAPDEKTAAYLSYLKDSPSPSHAQEVVDRLAKIRSPAAVEGLIGALDAGSAPNARRSIVEALGQIGDPAAVGSLSRIVERSEDPGERAASLRALAAIGDRRALETILGYASAEENRSALGLIQALDARKDPESVPALAKTLLERTYPDYQMAILRKLSRDGDPRVERTIQRAMERMDQPKLLAAAAETLSGIGTRDSMAFLQEKLIEASDPATRKIFQRAVKRIADRLAAQGGRG